jgi:hypothetical protein
VGQDYVEHTGGQHQPRSWEGRWDGGETATCCSCCHWVSDGLCGRGTGEQGAHRERT